MKNKPSTKKPTSRPFPFDVMRQPKESKLLTLGKAEAAAFYAIEGLEYSSPVVELFWVTFYFEYRRLTERGLQDNAKLAS